MGIDPSTVAKALDGIEKDVSSVCLRLMELILEREARESNGDTHSVGRGESVSDQYINYMICEMLDGREWYDDLEISRDLLMLIKYQLGEFRFTVPDRVEAANRKTAAVFIAQQLLVYGEPYSFRRVAEILDVSHTTLARQFSPGEFKDSVENMPPIIRKMIEEFQATAKIPPESGADKTTCATPEE